MWWVLPVYCGTTCDGYYQLTVELRVVGITGLLWNYVWWVLPVYCGTISMDDAQVIDT